MADGADQDFKVPPIVDQLGCFENGAYLKVPLVVKKVMFKGDHKAWPIYEHILENACFTKWEYRDDKKFKYEMSPGDYFFTIRGLVKETGFDRRAVKKHIEDLSKKLLIEVVAYANGRPTNGKAECYRAKLIPFVLVPALKPYLSTAVPDWAQGVRNVNTKDEELSTAVPNRAQGLSPIGHRGLAQSGTANKNIDTNKNTSNKSSSSSGNCAKSEQSLENSFEPRQKANEDDDLKGTLELDLEDPPKSSRNQPPFQANSKVLPFPIQGHGNAAEAILKAELPWEENETWREILAVFREEIKLHPSPIDIRGFIAECRNRGIGESRVLQICKTISRSPFLRFRTKSLRAVFHIKHMQDEENYCRKYIVKHFIEEERRGVVVDFKDFAKQIDHRSEDETLRWLGIEL